MDPTSRVFEAIMYPSAIYCSTISNEESKPNDTLDNPWADFSLGPKTRIDGVSPSSDASTSWRIDHGEAAGTKFFFIPKFAVGKPPLKIATYISSHEEHPGYTREALDMKSTMLVNGKQLANLAVIQHILCALEFWSNVEPDFESQFMSMPFGSRIIIDELTRNATKMPIFLAAVYEYEQTWETIVSLREIWNLPDYIWPPTIDFDDLQFHHQPHESITLVHIAGESSELFVFKSTERDIKYMYHELKQLLTMDRHQSIIKPPLFIVTKKCRFGCKIGVCGFILKYYPLGTLGDMLLQRSKAGMLKIGDQYRWARQLTAALIYLQTTTARFYSDLKLDNVVMDLQKDGIGIKLVDFEQRGGWYSWSPPEVYYIEYLEHLASTKSLDIGVRERYTSLMKSYLPNWKPTTTRDRYLNSDQGFSSAWLCLSPEEQEYAQVFMLGKILWCIFERRGAINGCVTVETFREEPSDQHFPEFRRTPMAMRECVRLCTSGAPEWQDRFPVVVRVGDKLYPRGMTGQNREPTASTQQTQDAARKWWQEEVEYAERFLKARNRQSEGVGELGDEGILSCMKQRPLLNDVHRMIISAEASL